ncbi:MAG: hypothetical protein AAF587_30235 [Bacteroidota bacterium]
MRTLFGLIVLFAILSPNSFAQKTSDKYDGDPFSSDAANSSQMLAEGFKRYEVESGIITYKLSGNMQSGTKTIYFDRWGLREATYEESVTKIFGLKQKSETISFLDGENMYNYDPKKNTYMRTKNTLVKPVADEMSNGEKSMTKGGKAFLEGMGGKLIGNETFMGKDCEIWELASLNSTNYIWKGVSLKATATLLGMTTEWEATDIQINVEVPEDKLSLPKKAKSVFADMGRK